MKKILIVILIVLIGYYFFKKDKFGNSTPYTGNPGTNSVQPVTSLTDSTGFFRLNMQDDGNLVIYVNPGPYQFVSWSTGTYGQGGGGPYKCYIQSDGNLVVNSYRTNYSVSIWTSNTGGRTDGPFQLTMQDDGNLCINGRSNIWCSMSALSVLSVNQIQNMSLLNIQYLPAKYKDILIRNPNFYIATTNIFTVNDLLNLTQAQINGPIRNINPSQNSTAIVANQVNLEGQQAAAGKLASELKAAQDAEATAALERAIALAKIPLPQQLAERVNNEVGSGFTAETIQELADYWGTSVESMMGESSVNIRDGYSRLWNEYYGD